MAASTWASPEIDMRIVELKQKGVSHTQIAVAICHEFKPTWVNKNMVLRRARTILGVDRGEKAANERLDSKRKAERAAEGRKSRERKPPPVNVPAPTVTLPPLASALVAWPVVVPVPVPLVLGNGKCTFPLWGNEPPTHEYCHKPTPLGSSFCPDCRRICFYRARAA